MLRMMNMEMQTMTHQVTVVPGMYKCACMVSTQFLLLHSKFQRGPNSYLKEHFLHINHIGQ